MKILQLSLMLLHTLLYSDCPILISPANGLVNVTGNSPGDSAIYTCGPDYDLVGVSVRVCGDDGQWSGEAPICRC